MKRIKEMRLLFVFIALLLGAALFSGCGNATKESGGGAGTVPIEDAANVGSSSCKVCHSLTHTTQLYGLVGQASPNSLGITHECEYCHGGGQYHFGSGPIPYPTPDINRCSACHDTQVSRVLASSHNGENAANTTLVTTSRTSGSCAACHTLEGYVEYAKVVTDNTTDQYSTLSPTPATFHYPGCAACHDPLKAQLRATPNWNPNNNSVSGDQFDVCTSCHKLIMPTTGTLIASGLSYNVSTAIGADGLWFTGDDTLAATSTVAYTHATSWYRIIASTHYDNPASPDVVEGYVVRRNTANPCFDCHGHELHTNTRYADTTEAGRDATPTIYTDWAHSGHAGGLLKVKYSVARDAAGVNKSGTTALTNLVMSVGATDASSNGGYTHYNWDSTFQADGVTSDRGACQMCHTSTGFANYVANPSTYDYANNDFSHLSSWAAIGGSTQNELLYCWGCHSNAETGALRVQGAVTATYNYGGVPVAFPDVGSSNTCVVCHAGRGNNEVVSTSSRFAGHHAPAAATLFSERSHVAYEFPGLSYAKPPYFAHDGISVDGAGPCASCHMSGTTPNHKFAVVQKNASGVITGIKADVCVTCHDGEHSLFVSQGLVGQTVNIWNGTTAVPTVVTQAMADAAAATLEEESEEYQEAGQLLLDLVNQANGLANYTGAVITRANVPDNDKGAFQNSKLTTEEKGGFAHNRFYVKRAIFDAIDWVEDGVINGTITDYTALGSGYQYAGAMTWLGTTRP